MVLKDLMRGTAFIIETSSYSKWILNENSEKFLGLNLNRICWNFFLGLQKLMVFGQRLLVAPR
jgi:hypothetical protein